MSATLKKAVSALFAIAILIAAALPAYASIKPNYSAYEYGDAYKMSNYYEQLLQAKQKLTGDHRHDLLTIALSQLGYHEGDSEEDMDGWNLDGSNNFVEYNRLFCKLDGIWGYAWCAAFVSWCQFQAGIPAEIDCSEVSCPRMINEILKPQDLYKTSSSGYIPLPGDLIYFKTASSGAVSTHVGIVIGVKDGYVYTVEGNANGNVGRHKYALTDSYVVGYGALKYETKEGTDYSIFSLVDDDYKPGKYTITADSLNVRSSPDSTSTVLGVLKNGEEVNITEFSDGWGKFDYKGKEGWVSASYIRDASIVIYTVEYKVGEGSFSVKQQRKRPGVDLIITEEIPKQTGHTFLGWSDKLGGEVLYKPGDKFTADASQKLHAVWDPDTVIISFADHDGSILATVEYDYGTRVYAPEGLTPARECDGEFAYEFTGWDVELSRYIKRDTTYTATYSARELTAEEKEAYLASQTTEPAIEAQATEAQNDSGTEKGCGGMIAILPAALIVFTAFYIIKRKEN